MLRLAFLGCGRLAEAMVRGILASGSFKPHEIGCHTPSGKSASALAAATGIVHVPDLRDLLAEASLLVLAFKPYHLEQQDPALRQDTAGKLVLSVLAGIRIQQLYHRFPLARNLVRAMPNLPGRIGAGITGFAWWKQPEPPDGPALQAILGPLGPLLPVSEDQLDAVTALSGSGVAFVAEFIAALREAGVAEGLSHDQAAAFALQTVLGTARLLAQSGQSPEDLIHQVATRGGTTEAGLLRLQADHFRPVLARCISAATQRARELSRP